MSIYPSSVASRFTKQVQEHSGQPLALCYQCRKCSGGCPMSSSADLSIGEIIRLCLLGARDEVLAAKGIWMCTGCRTCQDRCPNEIDGCRVKDALCALTKETGRLPAEQKISRFHAAFLGTVKYLGRAHELSLMGWYKLRTKTYLDQLPLGLKMFFRGKLPLFPSTTKGRRSVAKIMKRVRERS